MSKKSKEVKSIRRVSLDDRLWFGIHKGHKISEVPEDYIGWCIEKNILSVGEKDYLFTEAYQRQKAENEALLDFRYGDWGDKD